MPRPALHRVLTQDLTPWRGTVQPLIPVLLGVITSNTLAARHGATLDASSDSSISDGSSCSATASTLFFTASCLVRMANDAPLADALVRAGALHPLVALADPVAWPTVCQVAVFAMYKIHKAAQGQAGDEQPDGAVAAVLSRLASAGAFPQLCTVLHSASGSASELAFSLLLEMASQPMCHTAVADAGHVRHLVAALTHARSEPVRLKAILVMARLAHRSSECQLDAVREGAAAPLVEALARAGGGSTSDEAAHAARLLALLAQHESTHQRIMAAGGLRVALALLSGAPGGTERALQVSSLIAGLGKSEGSSSGGRSSGGISSSGAGNALVAAAAAAAAVAAAEAAAASSSSSSSATGSALQQSGVSASERLALGSLELAVRDFSALSAAGATERQEAVQSAMRRVIGHSPAGSHAQAQQPAGSQLSARSGSPRASTPGGAAGPFGRPGGDSSDVPGSPRTTAAMTGVWPAVGGGASALDVSPFGETGRQAALPASSQQHGLPQGAMGRASMEGLPVSPSMPPPEQPAAKVLEPAVGEQVMSLLAMLANNADNHFSMVGAGTVPILVPYLEKGES